MLQGEVRQDSLKTTSAKGEVQYQQRQLQQHDSPEMFFWVAVDAYIGMVQQLQVAKQYGVQLAPRATAVCWDRANKIFHKFIE